MNYDEAVEAAMESLEKSGYTHDDRVFPDDVRLALQAALPHLKGGYDREAMPSNLEVPADDASAVGEPDDQVVEAVAQLLSGRFGSGWGSDPTIPKARYRNVARDLLAVARDAGWHPAPSDEVLIDDTDYVPWSALPEYAANQKRAADEARREAKDYYLKLKELESAVTEPVPAPTVAPSEEAIYAALMGARREGRRDDTAESLCRELVEAVAAADPRESVEDAERRGAVRALEEAAEVIPGSNSGIGAIDPYDIAAEWLADRADRLREGQ